MPTSAATRGAQVSPTQIVFFVAIIIIFFGSLTDCLTCFQCEAINKNDPCFADWEGMSNKTTRKRYTKECEGPRNWTRCMILYSTSGNALYYLRDCHDGVYFPKDLNSTLFRNQLPDNYTTCDVINSAIVCYQACDEDLCNGPLEANCTLPNEDGCGARGIFVRNELMFLEIVGVLISFVMTTGIISFKFN